MKYETKERESANGCINTAYQERIFTIQLDRFNVRIISPYYYIQYNIDLPVYTKGDECL